MAVRRAHALARFQPDLQAGHIPAIERFVELLRKAGDVGNFRRRDEIESAASGHARWGTLVRIAVQERSVKMTDGQHAPAGISMRPSHRSGRDTCNVPCRMRLSPADGRIEPADASQSPLTQPEEENCTLIDGAGACIS